MIFKWKVPEKKKGSSAAQCFSRIISGCSYGASVHIFSKITSIVYAAKEVSNYSRRNA